MSDYTDWKFWLSTLTLAQLKDWYRCNNSQLEYLMEGATEPSPQEFHDYLGDLIQERRREQEAQKPLSGTAYTFFGEHIYQQMLATSRKRKGETDQEKQ
jgi:hypothetical protein